MIQIPPRPFGLCTQSFSRRFLLPFQGIQLEYPAVFREKFAGFSHGAGA
jgi:hypothetical protein